MWRWFFFFCRVDQPPITLGCGKVKVSAAYRELGVDVVGNHELERSKTVVKCKAGDTQKANHVSHALL